MMWSDYHSVIQMMMNGNEPNCMKCVGRGCLRRELYGDGGTKAKTALQELIRQTK